MSPPLEPSTNQVISPSGVAPFPLSLLLPPLHGFNHFRSQMSEWLKEAFNGRVAMSAIWSATSRVVTAGEVSDPGHQPYRDPLNCQRTDDYRRATTT